MLQELTQEDFLQMHQDGLTFKEIGEFYNLTERQVNYRTKKWGLDYSKKKKLDELFFSSGTKASYYWAGFIAADGYIEEDRDRLGIGLQLSDKEHLEKFKKAIKSDHDICNFMSNKACRIRFNSSQVVKDLRSIFNITGRKTYTYEFPNITEDYLASEFLRGYIDGDGHIGKHPSGSIYVTVCAYREEVVLSIKELIERLTGLQVRQQPYKAVNDKGTSHSLTLDIKTSKALLEIIYKNSTHATRLTRKFNTLKDKIMV